jgi:hypothetical protein
LLSPAAAQADQRSVARAGWKGRAWLYWSLLFTLSFVCF